jgi:hypothetical protein
MGKSTKYLLRLMCRPKFETGTFKMRANLLGSIRLLYQPWMVDESWNTGGVTRQGRSEVIGEKPTPVPIYQTYSPQELPTD